MSDSELECIQCGSCGIDFHFERKIADRWRDTHKTFFCPNGHGMSWSGETSEQKELKKLRVEVKELRAEVEAYKAKESDLINQVKELTNEIEIWKPTSK